MTVSSFADVRRPGYIERLSTDPADWDFSRIDTPAGVPLLLDHRQLTEARIGRLMSARVTPDGVIAVAHLSQAPEAERIVRDLEDGLPLGVSFGYVARLDETGETVDGVPVRLARQIELYEVSIVPVAADAGAHVRSMDATMNTNAISPNGSPAVVPPLESAERMSLAARYGAILGSEFFARRAGMPLGRLRREVLDELSRRDAIGAGHNQISCVDHSDRLQHAVQCALAARMGAKLSASDAALARSYMAEHGASVIDIGRGWLQAHGERIGTRQELATRLLTRASPHSTSDFPALLSAASNKVLIDAFEAAASGLLLLASETTATDFKPISLVKFGEAPRLNEVQEGAEITHGTIAEAKEALRIKTFARIFGISRQAIVNDDLGAFADTVRVIGRGAAETIAAELAALLSANGGLGVTLDDGQPLYHASHANTTTGALSVEALADARMTMRKQTGLDGTTPLNAVPRFLVVGPELETTAEQMLATLYPPTAADANPFAGRLQLVVEPRLPAPAWWLFADPAMLPVIRIAWLNGNRAPLIETRDGWEVLGVEYRAVLDFGCGIVDHRGTVRSTGV